MTSRARALAGAALVIGGLVVVMLLLRDDGSHTRSPYAKAAEQRCNGASRAIEQVDLRVRSLSPRERSRRRAESVFEIVGELRTGLLRLPTGENEALQAATLVNALLEAENGLILLRDDSFSGDGRPAAQTIRETAGAMSEVKGAARSLGLIECARLEIFPPSN